jgi:hypothetical protein
LKFSMCFTPELGEDKTERRNPHYSGRIEISDRIG